MIYQRVTVDGVRMLEHVAIAQRALGKPLPAGAVVHHANEDPRDNRPDNLVICPDRGYHALLHRRIKAAAACGNPDWRPCRFCKQHDAIEHLKQGKNRLGGESFHHAACRVEWERNR